MELSFDTPIQFVPRVGPAMAAKLAVLEIYTVRDLLYHIPFRYNDFSLVSDIARVQPGEVVTIKGTVERFNAFATKSGKRVQEAKVRDTSGVLSVIWFNQPFLRSVIKPGMTIHMAGSVNWFGNKLVMNSPEYELFEAATDADSLHTGRVVPVYSATEGLTSKWLRGRISFLLETLGKSIPDHIPDSIRKTHHLQEIQTALSTVHFPKTLADSEEARKRLAFDELFLLQAQAYMQKHHRETKQRARSLTLTKKDADAFAASLPFELTQDQKKAVEDILEDLSRSFPMNRLLVGDVGSGKTVVAAAAMYAAYVNKTQSALMAPTQILAEQHFHTLSRVLTPLGVKVGLVTGAHKDEGTMDVWVGTHALLSDTTKFKKLSLVVIDEQHRFGVNQRNKLIEKGTAAKSPHILTMTATPIPRTVAKTTMGHMELSTLTAMPKGRKQIKTWVVPDKKRANAYAWITKQIQETGGQVFIICPLIEESETLTTVRAVKKEYELLQSIFPTLSLGLLHGRMKPAEKTAVLDGFKNKKYHILVATPVVEVGIDIPNATIMVIEAADRFGLSQLHQLRGRVGRGELSSFCLLFTQSAEGASRLKILEIEASGPKLAEADLERRGAGDIMGTRQHGMPNLKIATFSDTQSIEDAQNALFELTKEDPELTRFPLLRALSENSTIEATKD